MGLSQRGVEAIALSQSDPSKILKLSVGPHESVSLGDYIPRADAKSAPSIAFPGASTLAAPAGPFVAICLDLDAPFASFAVLSPILHWIQSDLKVTSSEGTVVGTLATSTRPTCEWAPPGPPPGAAPHRYIVFLYAQPESFDLAKLAPPAGQKTAMKARVRFDTTEFEKKAGLGEILAASYFKSN